MSPAVVLESTQWTSYVCSSLETLRQEGILCDTTLLGKNGRTLLAHSCVLAAASPVLRTVVTQQNLASFLHSTHYISRGVWDVILEFIYRGKVAIDSVTDAKSIMAAAEKLELEKLRTLCEDFLHIEGAILKEEGPTIVLEDEPVVKIEPGVSVHVSRAAPAPVYVNVIPPAVPSEIGSSVRIKAEPVDDIDTTTGGGYSERTDGSAYSFATHTPTTTRPSPSVPVSQAVDRMCKWTSARMATDLTDRTPATVIPVDRLPHQQPGISYAADDAAITDSDVTSKLPLLTRTLMSASEKALPFYRDSRASADCGHEELPELVTVNNDGGSALYRSTMGPASSTVEDGPLCLVMPKTKPKTARKLRIPVTKPQDAAVNAPVFDSPNPSPAAIQHPNPADRPYPKLLYHPTAHLPIRTSGQHLTPASRSRSPSASDPCSIQSNFGVLQNSELRRRLARNMPQEVGTVVGVDFARDSRVCQISPGRIAQAEIPTAAVPFQVAAQSDRSIRKASEGRPLDDEEQIAIEVISQLSEACDVKGRGRRKKIMSLKRRHPSYNSFLHNRKGGMVTIKLKSPSDLTEGDDLDLGDYDPSLHGHNLTPDADTENSSLDLGTSFGDASPCIRPSPTSPRMLEERLLMRPWLETQLSAVTVPGLYWLNQERNLARIPWLHASRTSYHMDTDSCLFMLWAKHTGKYLPGRDVPDPKRWKANFRCALNSLTDVLEVKDSSQKRGREAFKVYEFLPQIKKYRKYTYSACGRRKKEEASSSGGETDLTISGGCQKQSLSPLIQVNGKIPNFPKILTGREIMTVMRRKAVDSDAPVDATGEKALLSPSPTLSLKPDSTVPSPDIRVETDVRPSLSPTTITQSADTSTHCTSMKTDVPVSPVQFKTAAVSTTPTNEDQWKMTTHCTSMETAVTASPIQFQTSAVSTTPTNEKQWKITTHCTSMETNVTASPIQFNTPAVSTTPNTNEDQWKMKKGVEVPSPQKGFSCRECSQWFAHTAMLAQHELMHAGRVVKDATTLGCIADIISLATMGQVVDQKPMET